MKWAVAVLLTAALLIGRDFVPPPPAGSPGPGTDAGSAANAPGSPAAVRPTGPGSTSAAGVPSLAIDRAADGSFRVRGVVADEATRNQWLNEIRIGAQGARVTDELRVGSVSSASAQWAGHLSGLVALLRERRLAGVRVDDNTVALSGVAVNAGEKGETEKMVQAQLPADFRLDSKLAIGIPPARLPGSAATGPSPPAAAPAAQKEGGKPPAVPARSEADRLAQQDAARQGAKAESAKPARTPADCPRRLGPLAQPVYFQTDGANLSVQDRERLQRLGECLGTARLRIVGHADPRLSEQYNQELSERRARAVADAVTSGGAASSRISVVGAGKSKPVSKGDSREELQRSRRVDLQIR